MPIYEFRCSKCGEKFEDLVCAGTETATCPKCGAGEAKRLFSAFGVKSGDSFSSGSSGCSSCSKTSCTSCKS
ncbi:MAG: zinc ribbon domain-containing protein [Actinobacteria bacterium]|nr:MAG: zinc ribbon domain-containing protein [Actinomycetota bacterium]